MAISNNRWKKSPAPEPSISRSQHSAILRRYQRKQEKNAATEGGADPGEESLAAADSQGMSDPPVSRTATAGAETETGSGVPEANTAPAGEARVRKGRNSLTLEQVLEYRPGKGAERWHVRVRLTTSARGLRKRDGLSETAYLLRLEILSASPGFLVAGISLGPWQVQDLALAEGSLWMPEPLWTAFQPVNRRQRGAVRVLDTDHHRILDWPWQVECILPGVEVAVA